MRPSFVKIAFFLLIPLFMLFPRVEAQVLSQEEHIEVSLRMIGHQLLLQAGDSTSRVLPISTEQGKYKISLDTEFTFNPDSLVYTVNEVVKDTRIGKGYNLQVLTCETGEVVYSYEIADLQGKNIIPCSSRDVPMGCYELLIILKNTEPIDPEHAEVAMNEVDEEDGQKKYIPFALGFMIFIGVLLMLRKRRKAVNEDPHVISLGRFLFDTRTAALTLDGEFIELSGKEAELLQVLCEKANETIARDVILNLVWGDEGDYVGRTLDVFISRLRKKLEKDPDLKIVNIRGVGYKLLVAA